MAKWGYSGAKGPANWGKDYPLANGNQQSPVDIQTGAAVKGSMSPLNFQYEVEDKVDISNAGWNVIGSFSKGSVLTGGPLGGTHKLASFHFHWGQKDDAGSEHKIDGKVYPAELHIVHYNSDKYGSFAEASDKPDGLGIIAVMVNVGAEMKEIKGVIDNVSKITATGSKATVSGSFDPKKMLPGDTSKFYCYHGSLTTPPCPESCEWILLDDKVSVSSVQLAALRTIKDGDGNNIVENCRPCCPLKGRTVQKSF